MAWSIEGTDEFRDWFVSLDDDEQQAVIRSVDSLEEFGPALTRPHADTIRGSAYPNMRELRSQVGGRPLRTLYAFDPRRVAILLIGGDKTATKTGTIAPSRSPTDFTKPISTNSNVRA